MKTIQVAAAVIRDGDRVFATQRGCGPQKDFWEFPGGKLEPGETPREALAREIREELDTEITVGELLTTVEWDYPDFHLHMDCFWAAAAAGSLTLKEHEAARWLRADELDALSWLPADRSIVGLLREALRAMAGTAKTDPFVDERDFALLQQDRYTFAVLDRILRRPVSCVRSDHSRLILCHSLQPWPVWIWTPDGITEEEKEAAWRLAGALSMHSPGYSFNLKYELAEAFLEKGRREGLNIGLKKALFAYDCPDPVRPERAADGGLYCCTEADIPEACALLPHFYAEVGETVPPADRILENVQRKIDASGFYFWKDGAGRTVACCAWQHNQGLASINDVYTVPEARRKHYAQNLVYAVTKLTRDAGWMPTLYTNADYAASNACYQKIGYRLRGRLCTLAIR